MAHGGIERIQQEHHAALLDAAAAGMRAEGMTFEAIGDRMGVSHERARQRVNRHYRRTAGPEAAEQRRQDLHEYDVLEGVAWHVLEEAHLVVQQGRIVLVRDADGHVVTDHLGRVIPLRDRGPVLEALTKILEIKRARERLMGHGAPSRRQIEVITPDKIAEAMEQLTAQMGDLEDADVTSEVLS